MVLTSIGIFAGIISIIAGFLIMLVDLKVWGKYKEKKQKPTLYLFFAIMGWVIASWDATVVYISAGFALEVAQVFQKIMYAGVFIGTIFMARFAAEIFFHIKKKWMWIYIGIGIGLVAILAIFPLSEVVDLGGYPVLLLNLDFSLVLVAYLFPTFLGIFIMARRASRKIEDPIYQVGYIFIALGNLIPIATFIIDTIATIVIDDAVLYPLFLALTWVFPLFGAIMYYLGWILPDGLRKRIEARQVRSHTT